MALMKVDILERLHSELGSSEKQSVVITESILELIASALKSENDLLASGFENFCVEDKKDRQGRNPATGEDAILSARRAVRCKCSGEWREKVNQKQ